LQVPPIEPRLVSRKNAAVALAISIRALDYIIQAGRLPVRRIGGRILIPISDLKRFTALDRRAHLVPDPDPGKKYPQSIPADFEPERNLPYAPLTY
jgi:hypothetical protein